MSAELRRAVRAAVEELLDSEANTQAFRDVIAVHLGRDLTDADEACVIDETDHIRAAIMRPRASARGLGAVTGGTP